MTSPQTGSASFQIETLKGIVLPQSGEFKRDYVPTTKPRGPEFDGSYDFQTLVYDAFYIPSKRSICLICPKLLNFESLVREGRFMVEGEELRIASIWHFKRYAQIWLRCHRKPTLLRFEHKRLEATIAVPQEQYDMFRGLNCAVLKSKDNDLIWVKDWADYHVRVHGLQGIVFFDNGSSRYEPGELLAVLQQVQGLKSAKVLSAPFPFGCKGFGDTMFLQVGVLNIARLRFCFQAAAVLCTDLDELVAPVPPAGIFAATRRSPLGYLLFRGRWRESKPVRGGDILRHFGHVYRSVDDLCAATKYCIDPQGLCGFSHWDVHGAVRGFLKNYLTTTKYQYWHCRQICTNWNRPGDTGARDLQIAPETAKAFAEYFGGTAPLAEVL